MLFLALNFVFFQMLWFANVLGAGSYGLYWLGLAGVLPLLVLTAFSPERRSDLAVALLALAGGMLLDTLWIALGILRFDDGTFAPFWIGSLWFGLGLTINHSMRWFRDQKILGPLIVGAFGPVTYLTGQSLGAVEVVTPWLLPLVSAAWIVFFAGLVRSLRIWQPALAAVEVEAGQRR